MSEAVDIKCPECRRYLATVPAGTPIRVRCRDCAVTIERVAKVSAQERVRMLTFR